MSDRGFFNVDTQKSFPELLVFLSQATDKCSSVPVKPMISIQENHLFHFVKMVPTVAKCLNHARPQNTSPVVVSIHPIRKQIKI